MADKKLILYALSTCPSCKKTAKMLEDMGAEFEKIEVDLLPSGEQWVTTKEVKKYNPAASFPTLIISDIIVGYDEERIKKCLKK